MIRFGPFELDPSAETLKRGSEPVRLQPQPFKLLAYLASRPGTVVTREELQQQLWGADTFVEFDQGLNFCIRQVRAALGDSADTPTYIETVPRRGYRFLAQTSDVRRAPASASDAVSRRWIVGAIGLGVVIAAAVAGWWFHRDRRGPDRTPPIARFEIAPPSSGGYFGTSGDRPLPDTRAFATLPAVSPDGRFVVFTAASADGRVSLWLRRLDDPLETPLPDTDGGQFPFWSPDGAAIGFFSADALRVGALDGARTRVVCDVANGRGGAWNRDGTIVFGSTHDGLFTVASTGGAARPLTRLRTDAQELAHRWPALLPDGHHVLYSSVSSLPGQSAIWLASMDGGDARRLVATSGRSMFVAPDHVLYAVEAEHAADPPGYPGRGAFLREATLVSRRLDVAHARWLTEAVPLVEHVRFDANGGLELSVFSASDDGVVAFREPDLLPATALVWFDRRGTRLGTLVDDTYVPQPDISPDGRFVAFEQFDRRTATDDVWTIDVSTHARTRLTFDAAHHVTPVWSPDGAQVVFSSTGEDLGRLFIASKDGGGAARPVPQDRRTLFPTSWSRDGRSLVVMSSSTDGNSVQLLNLADGTTTVVAEHGANGSLSPDGRWIAFTVRDARSTQIVVQPVPSNGSKWQVTSAGGSGARWRGDGRELFFQVGDDLMSVDVDASRGVPHFGAPRRLFAIHPPHGRVSPRNVYAVTRDGERFLVDTIVKEGRSAPVTVLVGLRLP